MTLENYALGTVTDWASLIFARVIAPTPPDGDGEPGRDVLLGYVFVIDPKFGPRAQYKMPGGHKKGENGTADRTPLDTAVREFEGETGIELPRSAFDYVGKWLGFRGDHWKCLFRATLSRADRDWMNSHHKENEGERPEFFTAEELLQSVRDGKFLPEHFQKLDEYALVTPFGREL